MKSFPSHPKIRIRGLCKRFGTKIVLDHLDLDIQDQESFVIIGGSGTGKSVLIKCILGLIEPDSGSIEIDGRDILQLNNQQRTELYSTFGVLFQGGALFDSLRIWENIAFVLLNQGMDKTAARQAAYEKLEQVNLNTAVADLFPAELSGGMQKRVALARAIAAHPQVIFFDEPTTGLDPIVSGTINNLITQCVQEIGATAVTITHDMNSVRHIANQVGLLVAGKLAWCGSVEEMDTTDHAQVQQFIHGNPVGPLTDPVAIS